MWLSAFKWLAFALGWLSFGIMVHYAMYFFPDATNPRRSEMVMGFILGAYIGWPAWLALPAFAYVQRKVLPPWRTALVLAPMLAVGVLFVVGQLLVRGAL